MLEPLIQMFAESTNYGIVLVNGDKCQNHLIIKSGKHIDSKLIAERTVCLQKRQKKGGQSAQRIGRIRDEKENIYIHNIVESLKSSYLTNDKTPLIKNILIAGNANIKKKVIKHSEYIKYFEKITVGLITTDTIDKIKPIEIFKDNQELFNPNLTIVSKIKKLIEVADDKLVFGLDECIAALEGGFLESLALSDVSNDTQDEINTIAQENGCSVTILDFDIMEGINMIGIKWF